MDIGEGAECTGSIFQLAKEQHVNRRPHSWSEGSLLTEMARTRCAIPPSSGAEGPRPCDRAWNGAPIGAAQRHKAIDVQQWVEDCAIELLCREDAYPLR